MFQKMLFLNVFRINILTYTKYTNKNGFKNIVKQ